MTVDDAPPFSHSLSLMPTDEQLAALIDIEGQVQLKAAQLGMLCNEYRANLARLLHHFEPQLAPLQAIIYAGARKRRDIEIELVWLERIIVMQERRGGSRLLPVNEIRTAEQDVMLPLHKAIQDSYQQLHIVTKEELAVLRDYECPPRQALATMTMAMRVRREDDTSWSTVQVVLSENYFFAFFISRAQTLLLQPIPDDVMEELNCYCLSHQHTPEALARISVPLGAIGQWLHAVRNYFYAKKVLTLPEEPLTVEKRREIVMRLRHELETIKDDVNTASEDLKKLQERMVRKKVEVRNEYDCTMCPLHDSLEKKAGDFVKVLGGDMTTLDGGEHQQQEQEEVGDDASALN